MLREEGQRGWSPSLLPHFCYIHIFISLFKQKKNSRLSTWNKNISLPSVFQVIILQWIGEEANEITTPSFFRLFESEIMLLVTHWIHRNTIWNMCNRAYKVIQYSYLVSIDACNFPWFTIYKIHVFIFSSPSTLCKDPNKVSFIYTSLHEDAALAYYLGRGRRFYPSIWNSFCTETRLYCHSIFYHV